MDSERLDALRQEAADAAVRWAKTGNGFSEMEAAVNLYAEVMGSNRAIGNDPEAIRLSREVAALQVNIDCIHALTKDQEQRLHDTLMRIAEDGVPRLRRGLRR